MVDALDVLLDSGNTVVVAEHDIPVAASADWVIDLGPGAGPDGGAVVAAGAPEAVATADTPTASFFRRYAAGLPLLEIREDLRCPGTGAGAAPLSRHQSRRSVHA